MAACIVGFLDQVDRVLDQVRDILDPFPACLDIAMPVAFENCFQHDEVAVALDVTTVASAAIVAERGEHSLESAVEIAEVATEATFGSAARTRTCCRPAPYHRDQARGQEIFLFDLAAGHLAEGLA